MIFLKNIKLFLRFFVIFLFDCKIEFIISAKWVEAIFLVGVLRRIFIIRFICKSDNEKRC